MRAITVLILAGLFSAVPVLSQDHPAQTAKPVDAVVAKVIARENQEMAIIRQRSPLVETYIQKVRSGEGAGSWQPDGDHYFLGWAEFSKGLNIEPLSVREPNSVGQAVGNVTRRFDFGTEFLPGGFLQMIYLDNSGLDMQNYKFEYIRREFLGEVRTLVFDVSPVKESAKGRFIGRIWVEDEGYTIVRFDGAYSGRAALNAKFHFDSWRVNTGPNLWLPAFIYSEENRDKYPLAKAHITYKAQTRLWGYEPDRSRQEEELGKVVIESATPVVDQSRQGNDLSPVQQTRAWEQQAADNVIDKLEETALVAPRGDIDKVLETVVNNLEVTNNLDIEPEIQCRVLMTSTIESFTVGHTIVLSRGLIDVLPDEPSLAAMLAKEMGHILIDHKKVDTRYAFFDRLHFDGQDTFQHFDFERSPEEDAAASAKGAELLKHSPYKDQLATAEIFIAELQQRSREIPNLISPRLGDVGLIELPVVAKPEDEATAQHIVALPLGGRIKFDPWSDTLTMLKAQPEGTVSDREKMPFEIAPFMIYLTREGSDSPKTSEFGVSPLPAN